MFDQIKEIYNGKLEYADYVGGKVTLFTTDANTQFLIKDIQIEPSDKSPYNGVLKINDFTVASLATPLSGNEIVDINSAVTTYKREFNNVADSQSYNIEMLSHDDDIRTFYMSGARLNSLMEWIPGEVVETTFSALGATHFDGYMIGEDFYYSIRDTVGSSALYKRVGGINGVDVLKVTKINYAPVTFDGVSKFYQVNAANKMTVFDTDLGARMVYTVSGLTLGTTGGASTVCCAGHLFHFGKVGYALQVVRLSDKRFSSHVYEGSTDIGRNDPSGTRFSRCLYAMLSPDKTKIEIGSFSTGKRNYCIYDIATDTIIEPATSEPSSICPGVGLAGKVIRITDSLVYVGEASSYGFMQYGGKISKPSDFFDYDFIDYPDDVMFPVVTEIATDITPILYGSVNLRITGIETKLS